MIVLNVCQQKDLRYEVWPNGQFIQMEKLWLALTYTLLILGKSCNFAEYILYSSHVMILILSLDTRQSFKWFYDQLVCSVVSSLLTLTTLSIGTTNTNHTALFAFPLSLLAFYSPVRESLNLPKLPKLLIQSADCMNNIFLRLAMI